MTKKKPGAKRGRPAATSKAGASFSSRVSAKAEADAAALAALTSGGASQAASASASDAASQGAASPSGASASGGASQAAPKVSGLLAAVSAARQGDSKKAKASKPMTPQTAKDKKAGKAKTEAPEFDEDLAENLAGAIAKSEAALGALFVDEEKAGTILRASDTLKFGWQYYFIKEGVNGWPSWLVLTLTHLGFLATILALNKDAAIKWAQNIRAQLFGKKKTGEDLAQKATTATLHIFQKPETQAEAAPKPVTELPALPPPVNDQPKL